MSNREQRQVRMSPAGNDGDAIFRLPPYFYMHVLDLNSNVTRVVLGPQTFIRQDNERVVLDPTRMITVPPRNYCVIEHPALRDQNKEVVKDASGQVRLAHADLEIRLTQDPFPLYPGEILNTPPTPLKIVAADSALRLKAILDFEDETEKRVAGDEWLFEGPGTYIPRKEVQIEETIRARIILPNQALKLRACREGLDRENKQRVTGEEWLVSKVGAYLPGAYEEVVDIVNAYVLTDKKALHVRATKTFKDQFEMVRKNGEEWLVKMDDAETYIPDVYEDVVDIVNITTLTNRQYCVIVNPCDATGKPQLGKRRLVKGEKSFFLQPGEKLEQGIQDIYVLSENEGLILRANEAFKDEETGEQRQPGDRWMIKGPMEYVPPVEVEVLTKRTAMPLDENEGIYVRDIKTGRVRAVIGTTYMLTQDEEMWPKILEKTVEDLIMQAGGMQAEWSQRVSAPSASTASFGVMQAPISFGQTNIMPEMIFPPSGVVTVKPQFSRKKMGQNEEPWPKELPSAVENLLQSSKDPLADRSDRNNQQQQQQQKSTTPKRDKTRVVTFRVPHNAAVQIYDFKDKKARVVFGPELVMLGPDEHFTQLSLSGGKPKRPNVIKSLCLLLGPDFCTDIVTVETSDHARLQLQLSYNWHFDSGDKSQEAAAKLFSVPDFVGDACKAIASRVRGMVAQVPFDEFHKNSARIIRSAVFGLDENGKVRDRFLFPQNNLVVTSTDIQSVEPVDQRTRDSLQKSVQLAIEITTNSQEATARHEAERLEQEARGRLERQKITDEASAERARKDLLELQATSAAVESTGQAKAEAQSQAEAAKIEGEAAVEQARLKAEASKIETEAELSRLRDARQAELQYTAEKNSLEISKAKQMADIETNKFNNMVSTLGASTIQAIAVSGPEMQVKMLQSLGLQSTLITDGSSPINLFQTAHGLIGTMQEGGQPPKKGRITSGDDESQA